MPYHPDDGLIHHSKETYGASFDTALIEQYKIYVQSAENVSARRIASIRYLLTINAALVALYGFQSTASGQTYWTLLIPPIGIIASLLSYKIIKSHAALNRVKFKIIHEFEQLLPLTMYTYEWKLAEEGKGSTYRAVTGIEQWLPILFVVLHMIVFVVEVVLVTSALLD